MLPVAINIYIISGYSFQFSVFLSFFPSLSLSLSLALSLSPSPSPSGWIIWDIGYRSCIVLYCFAPMWPASKTGIPAVHSVLRSLNQAENN